MNNSETLAEIRELLYVQRSVRVTDRERELLQAWIDEGTSRGAADVWGVDQSVVSRALSRVRKRVASVQKTPRVFADQNEYNAAHDRVTVEFAAKAFDAGIASDRNAPEVFDNTPPVHPTSKHRAKQADKAAKAEHESVVKELAELQDRVELFADLTGKPLPPVRRRELSSGLREATAVALFSDWHVETLVKPQDTATGNTFTLSIADLRISRAFAGVEWLTQSASENFAIRDLVLWLGGDFITNHLHPENIETAQLGPAGALLWVQSRIIDGIQRLLDSGCYETIRIVCSYGNHGRTTDKMRSSTSAQHSWEWVMYQAIAFHFRRDPRVMVLADEPAHQYLNVYNFDVHFHHGHDVKYGGGVGGIMIPINKAVSGWNRVRFCHLHNFGHFHQYLNVGGVCVNGSLIGYDSYSLQIKAVPETPAQAFYLIDSKRGQTMCSPIWVGDPNAERELWAASAHAYKR